MDFIFSCNICHTKVYTTFAKVVVIFTGELAKLVSHFSDFRWISMQFTRFLQTHTRLKESFCKQALRNFWTFTTIPSSQQSSQISPRQRRGARHLRCGTGEGNKRAWAVIGLTRARLRCLVRPERLSASGRGGAGATRPWRSKVRWRRRHGWALCGGESSNVT
jgi:hypothetical protein